MKASIVKISCRPGETPVLWVNAGGKDFRFETTDRHVYGLLRSISEWLYERETGRNITEPY